MERRKDMDKDRVDSIIDISISIFLYFLFAQNFIGLTTENVPKLFIGHTIRPPP